MAVVNTILDRLCGLEGSNFTVTDVKVFETQVTWRIEHKDDPKYICPRCEAVHNTAFEKNANFSISAYISPYGAYPLK